MTDPAVRNDFVDLARIAEPGDERLGRVVDVAGASRVMAVIRQGGTGRNDSTRSWRLPLEGLHARWIQSQRADPDVEAAQVGARIITRCDAEWPTQLADLGDREPYALWVVGAGSLRLLALRSIAVVGARACTAYGSEIARQWSGRLAESGWVIMSGGASGIDAAAHRGALDSDGVSVAVMPGGVDVAYPRSHDMLFARIADNGLLISEVPPGETVRRQRFLARNRLIAGLSRATVVVEAALRSGTTATARYASEINRPVLAVPGSVHSPASAGCHRMIRDSEATIVLGVDDILSVIDSNHAQPAVASGTPSSARDLLNDNQLRVLDSLPAGKSASLDRVMGASGLNRRDILIALGALEVDGWISRTSEGWRLARRL